VRAVGLADTSNVVSVAMVAGLYRSTAAARAPIRYVGFFA